MEKRIIVLMFLMICLSVVYAQNTKNAEEKIDKSKAVILNEIEVIKKSVDTSKVRAMSETLRTLADEISTPLYDHAYALDNYADSLKIDMPAVDSSYSDEVVPPYSEDVLSDTASVGGDFKMPDFANMTKNLEKMERKPKMTSNVAYGLVSAIAGKPLDANVKPKYEIGPGYYFHIFYGVKQRLKKTEKLTYFYRAGLCYETHNLEQKTYYRFTKVNDKAVANLDYPASTDDADMNFQTLSLPLSVDIKINKGNVFSVGGYVGYVIGMNQFIQYTEDGNRVEKKTISDFGANKIRYGLKFEFFTKKGLGLFAQMDLNQVLKGNVAPANMYSIGLVIGK